MNHSEYESFDEDDDTPLSVRLANLDGIWEKKRRSRELSTFEMQSGPCNIPDNVNTPKELFLCLLSNNIIDNIISETLKYCQ